MIRKYIFTNKLFLFAIIGSSFFWSLALSHPYIFYWYAGRIVENKNFDNYFSLSIWLLIILGFSVFIFRFLAWATIDIAGEIGNWEVLKKFVAGLFNRKDPGVIKEYHPDLKRTLSRDFYIIRSQLLACIGDNIGSILELAIAFVAIQFIDIRLFFVFIFVSTIFFILNNKVLKKIKISSVGESKALAVFIQKTQDFVNLRIENKLYDVKKWSAESIETSSRLWGAKVEELSAYQAETYLFQSLCSRPVLIGVIIVGSVHTSISPVVVGAIISGVLMLNSALAQTGFTMNQYINIKEALSRFISLDIKLGKINEDGFKNETDLQTLNLNLSNVVVYKKRVNSKIGKSFCYNLMIQHPGIYHIKGPTGYGKTTLLEAISGYILHSGKILIGDKEVSDESHLFRSSSIGYLPVKMADFNIPISEIIPLNELKKYPEFDPSFLISDLDKSSRHFIYAKLLLSSSKKIVMFDEPISVMNEKHSNYFKNEIKEKSQSKIIIIASHEDIEAYQKIQIESVCDISS